jgi:glutathione synthase/RimK-type ligase-like ATP-grasp enzyme
LSARERGLDVAVLTCAELLAPKPGDAYVSNVHLEDGMVVEALRARGLSAERVDWASAGFDWSAARVGLFRTTWDYHLRFGDFSAWLDRVAGRTALCNPARTLRWNLDKHYLLDLDRAGVCVAPTRVFERGAKADLAALMKSEGWDEAVFKPVVSGAARETYRVRREDASLLQPTLERCLAAEAMLVQRFVEGVVEAGEVSVVVLGGTPTHAVRKVPKSGDFRVQDDHGGTVHAHAAATDELRFAAQAVARSGHELAYARVDMARDRAGRLHLMELELIEPELFFRFCPSAAGKLADEVAKAVSARGARRG